MEKQYAINLIRELFENPFSKEKFTFFIKNLLNHIEDAPFVYRRADISNIYQEDVKTIERIGKYQDVNGKQLDILIVTFLRDETLERARSLQRNIIAWYLNGGRGGKMKDAALVAFISPNNQDWRFSFVKMEYKYDSGAKKIKETYTPAKRYSYLVGPHEASHTAQSMMIPVLLNDAINPTLEEIEAIFKIEKVTKEFFEKYKELFFNLADEFTKNQEFNKKVVGEHAVQVADFVKKLMGQIVFLYFLQKKGWLGVKSGQKWGSGDKKFMHNLFHKNYCEYSNFYNDVLEPLFYDTLNNRDRGNSSVVNDQSYSPYFKCRIPYLNGGLFTPVYDWAQSIIFIDNKYFQDIFDVFDTFNFTVFESDPIEKEVAVDPEMLGKVFENLLEVRDRKSKGAFYTPREIVHYMCQESLINYLISQSGYTEKRIRNLMKTKDQEVGRTEKNREGIENVQDLKEVAEVTSDLLIKVRICDPAVGSGAFPMGLLKEISSIRYFLNKHFLKKKNKHNTLLTEYDIKKETLENCIYGVDIDPGAVEIARLRFWLALVVEHEIEEIEPLPNLDYKIMQGNSLIELYSPTLLIKTSDKNRNKIIEQLSIAKNEYFNLSDSLSKSNKREEINLLTRSIVNYDKNIQRENIWQKIIDVRSQLNLFKKQKNEDQLTIGDITDKSISKELKELNKIENISNIEHFEWHLNFNEVFEKGGFDIVIGNPPYIQLQNNDGELANKLQNEGYKTFIRTGDIYSLFYERGLNLAKINSGLLCFITSNKWMRAGYGQKTRGFFTSKNPIQLIDFGGFKVFESATVDTNILLIQNSANTRNLRATHFNNDYKLGESINEYFNTHYQELNDINDDSWYIGNKNELNLKAKIESTGTPLKNWEIHINFGVKTGFNDAFIIDKQKRDDILLADNKSIDVIKPVLHGKNIQKYGHLWSDQYMLFIPWHFPLHNDSSIQGSSEKAKSALLNKYPAIHKYLYQYKEKLTARNKKETEIRYEWYALQRCAASYYKEFEREKIVWREITSNQSFCLAEKGLYIVAPATFLVSKNNDLKYLLGVLNSKMILWYFSCMAHNLGESGLEWKKAKIEMIPIPTITLTNITLSDDMASRENNILKIKKNFKFAKEVETLVDQVLTIKKLGKDNDTKDLESQIDQLVYKLYDLTDEEIKIVEGN